MSLDEARQRRANKIFNSNKKPQLQEGDSVVPRFVKHCVAAIVGKPKVLARIQSRGGNPIRICKELLARNPELAARHAVGQHHTPQQYENAIKVLHQKTEELRASRVDRSRIMFEMDSDEPRGHERRGIVFRPQD